MSGKNSLRLLMLSCAALAAGCASTGGGAPPRQISDACAILDEKDAWEDDVFDAARRWAVSPGTILSFVRQESGFRHNARPVDRNGRPLSSALGYSQALDGTWADYQRARGGSASRKSFEASADFIGWYLDTISRQTGLAKTDPRNLYLAYHEGPAGFRRGTHRSKAWLMPVADRVAANAAQYDSQLRRCEGRRMRQVARVG